MKNEYGNSPWSNSPLQILHKIYLPATLYFVIFGYYGNFVGTGLISWIDCLVNMVNSCLNFMHDIIKKN